MPPDKPDDDSGKDDGAAARNEIYIEYKQVGQAMKVIHFGTERIRLTPGPTHSDAEMDHLINALNQLWGEMDLQRAA